MRELENIIDPVNDDDVVRLSLLDYIPSAIEPVFVHQLRGRFRILVVPENLRLVLVAEFAPRVRLVAGQIAELRDVAKLVVEHTWSCDAVPECDQARAGFGVSVPIRQRNVEAVHHELAHFPGGRCASDGTATQPVAEVDAAELYQDLLTGLFFGHSSLPHPARDLIQVILVDHVQDRGTNAR